MHSFLSENLKALLTARKSRTALQPADGGSAVHRDRRSRFRAHRTRGDRRGRRKTERWGVECHERTDRPWSLEPRAWRVMSGSAASLTGRRPESKPGLASGGLLPRQRTAHDETGRNMSAPGNCCSLPRGQGGSQDRRIPERQHDHHRRRPDSIRIEQDPDVASRTKSLGKAFESLAGGSGMVRGTGLVNSWTTGMTSHSGRPGYALWCDSPWIEIRARSHADSESRRWITRCVRSNVAQSAEAAEGREAHGSIA